MAEILRVENEEEIPSAHYLDLNSKNLEKSKLKEEIPTAHFSAVAYSKISTIMVKAHPQRMSASCQDVFNIDHHFCEQTLTP
jgi:hypothetical protein